METKVLEVSWDEHGRKLLTDHVVSGLQEA